MFLSLTPYSMSVVMTILITLLGNWRGRKNRERMFWLGLIIGFGIGYGAYFIIDLSGR